ncbi:MAG TPA: hypothetical protein VK174_10680 [Chitinophagales bacterium]|nr:hypothetical protein [Chitinophagales bacterium]
MLKITDQNFEVYEQVFYICWSHYASKLPAEIRDSVSPTKAMEQLKYKSKANARSGLKMGLSDMIIMLSYAPEEVKTNINEELVSKGLPSINKIISEIRDIVPKLIKRGKIKNLDEYYIIKEFIDDVDSNISKEERVKLNDVVFDFENRKRS